MKHQIVLLSFVFIFLFSVSISAYETDKIDLKGSFNRANARENFYSEKSSVFLSLTMKILMKTVIFTTSGGGLL